MDDEEKRTYDEHLENMLIAKDIALTIRGKALLEGEIKGRQEGIQEGILEWKFEVAQKLKEMGLSMEEISKATEISLTELEEYLNKPKG